MEHEVHNPDEALEVIAAYLERIGVEGLRQPYDPEQINRSAVIRYLINEKLAEVLSQPPAAEGTRRRVGPAKRKAPPISADQSPKLRRGSKG
jgi:hypothetical protein